MKYKARIISYFDKDGNKRYTLSYVSQQDGQRIESSLEARDKDKALDEAARQLDIRISEIEVIDNSTDPSWSWGWGNSNNLP